MRFWIIALLLASLCGIAPDSLAAPAPGPAATTIPTISNPAFKQAVVAALNGLHTAGYALRGKLVQTGEELLAVFLALSLGWSIFNGLMAQRLDAMFKDIINELIIALIALVLLWTWTGPGQVGSMSMSNFLTQGLNGLVAPFISPVAAGPNQAVTTQVAEMQIIDDCFAAAGNILSVIPKIWQGTTVGGTIVNMAENALQGIFIGETTGPGFAIAYIMLVIVISFICALTVLTVMLFGLLYINLGDFIIYVGLAIGPVFVATLALPPIRQMFTRWLDFVLTGVFYKVIAVVVAAFLPPLFAAISTNSTTVVALNSAWIWDIAKNILGFLLYGAIMLFWSGFTLFLIKQVPTLAHSLIGGTNLHVTHLGAVMPPLAKKAVSVVKSVAMAGLGAAGGVAGEASVTAGGASVAAGGADAKTEYREMTKQDLAENRHKTGAAQEFRDRMHKIKRRKALASMKGGLTDDEGDNEEENEE